MPMSFPERMKKGESGETLAKDLLRANGYEVWDWERPKTAPFDFIAGKGGQKFGVNVKYGKSHAVAGSNIRSMLRASSNYEKDFDNLVVPAFLFLAPEYACLFILADQFGVGLSGMASVGQSQIESVQALEISKHHRFRNWHGPRLDPPENGLVGLRWPYQEGKERLWDSLGQPIKNRGAPEARPKG